MPNDLMSENLRATFYPEGGISMFQNRMVPFSNSLFNQLLSRSQRIITVKTEVTSATGFFRYILSLGVIAISSTFMFQTLS